MKLTIREARMKSLMTQVELAEKMGIQPTTISKWETGIRIPTMKLRREFLKVTGLKEKDVDFLCLASKRKYEGSKI